jgi:quinol monooxygenase YgiN
MTEVLLIARHTMAAGKEAEVLELLAKLIDATRAEPGNLSFVAYRQFDDERSYVLLERYESAEALDAHRRTAHFQELVLDGIVPRLESRTLETYDITE